MESKIFFVIIIPATIIVLGIIWTLFVHSTLLHPIVTPIIQESQARADGTGMEEFEGRRGEASDACTGYGHTHDACEYSLCPAGAAAQHNGYPEQHNYCA